MKVGSGRVCDAETVSGFSEKNENLSLNRGF